MSKIVEFKSKQTKFKEWVQEVVKENFEDKNIESAIFIWEIEDENGFSTAMEAKFNCDLKNKKWFYYSLGENIRELEFDKFMREHVKDYIEIIND